MGRSTPIANVLVSVVRRNRFLKLEYIGIGLKVNAFFNLLKDLTNSVSIMKEVFFYKNVVNAGII